jgi:hypothetical protein
MQSCTPTSELKTDPACAAFASVLTQIQYLTPHAACLTVIAKAADRTGLCGQPADRALRRLDIRPSLAVGRLSRSQLLQLAHTLYRFARRLPAPLAAEPAEAVYCRI